MTNYKQQTVAKTGSLDVLTKEVSSMVFNAISIGADSYDAITDETGTDIQVPVGKTGYIGYLDLKVSTAASLADIGYADDATGGTNFKVLIPQGMLVLSNNTYNEHTQLHLEIPGGKYLVAHNDFTGASVWTILGWIAIK